VFLDALVYRYAARVEHHLLNNVESQGTVKVEWAKEPIELSIDESIVDDDRAYPVSVSIVGRCRGETGGTITVVLVPKIPS
jgi:hypothetical protein